MNKQLMDDAVPVILERVNAIVGCATVAIIYHMVGLHPTHNVFIMVPGVWGAMFIARRLNRWYSSHYCVRYGNQE